MVAQNHDARRVTGEGSANISRGKDVVFSPLLGRKSLGNRDGKIVLESGEGDSFGLEDVTRPQAAYRLTGRYKLVDCLRYRQYVVKPRIRCQAGLHTGDSIAGDEISAEIIHRSRKIAYYQ